MALQEISCLCKGKLLLRSNYLRFKNSLFSILSFSLIALIALPSGSADKESSDVIVNKLLQSINSLKTLSCEITNTERIGDKLLTGSQKINASFNPLKCHVYFIAPNSGSQVVFVQGKNNNEIKYIPSGFPYFSLNFDPLGSIARRNNHHTILEVGFQYFAKIIANEFKRSPELFEVSRVLYNKKETFLVAARLNNFKLSPYQMAKEETIRDIAHTFFINEYKILESNPELSSYQSRSENKILIPSHYCKQINIYLNTVTYLPECIEVYDEKGLFEKYTYANMIVNPVFSSDQFSLD